MTAEKREQNIQDVPIAMTAFGAEELEKRGFTRLDDLAAAVPNLTIVSASDARTTQFTVRGVTGQTRFPGAESSVGIFVDGVFVNNPVAQNFDLLDIERVEVLRGPQGTLYGKNTTAGAINLITRRPSDAFTGSLLAEYGNYDHLRLQGGVSGPLVEGRLYGGLSVSHRKRDGFGRNVTRGDDFDTADVSAVRAALRFTPVERLEINLAADALWEDRTPGSLDDTPFDRRDDFGDEISEKRQVQGVNLTAEYEFPGGVTLTSITAWRDYEFARVGDDDGVPARGFISPVRESTEQVSQELRLASPSGGRLEWLGGVYLLGTELQGANQPFLDPNVIFQLNTGLSCSALLPAFLCGSGLGNNRIEQDTQTVAAFGQAVYRFSDEWSVTLGARVSREEKDFRVRQTSTQLPLFFAVVDGRAEVDGWSTSPRATISFEPNANVNAYVTAAKGFKSGGFNTSPIANAAQLQNVTYDDEKLWSYEAGVKTTWFDRRLVVNLAAFRIEYTDLQVFRFEETSPGVFSARVTNAASAISEGFEVEVRAVPFTGLSINAGLGYTDAKFDRFPNCGVTPTVPPQARDCSGNRLTYAPKWTAGVNATYEAPFSDDFRLIVFGDWSYRTKTWFNIFNDPAETQGAYSVLSGSITLARADDAWSVALWGENLTDTDYVTFTTPGFRGSILKSPGAPRTYGVRLTGRF